MIEKLCIPYKMSNDYGENLNSKAGSFDIVYNPETSTVEDFAAFVEKFPDKRIVVSFPDGFKVNIAKTLDAIGKDVAFRVKSEDIMSVQEATGNGLKVFFDADAPAYNWSTLESMLALGVSDVYISDDLCYQMDDVREKCRDSNVGIRIVLNRIPARYPGYSADPCAPVYRPEDAELVDKYYDWLEFDCGKPVRYNELDVYTHVWFDKGKWNGDLGEINKDLSMPFPNKSLVPEFSFYKSNCNLRCKRSVMSKCRKCGQFLEIAQMLQDKGVALKFEQRE